MKLQLYIYQCDHCKNKFKSPNLIEGCYGEFIMRSENGESVYMNSFDDHVFHELENICDSNLQLKNLNRSEEAKIFHQIFSITCDLSTQGKEFQIGTHPVCPKCGSNDMDSWHPTNPPEIIEENIPIVKHERWNKLTTNEKKFQVEEKIKKIYKISC